MVFRLVVFLFHLATFVMYAFGVYFDLYHVKVPFLADKEFGGRWKYLTFWNLVVQTIFFGLAVACDCQILARNISHIEAVASKAARTSLIKLRDFLFTVVGFPVSVFVCSVFWGLYSIDRDLIFPEALDKFIPSWLNHIMHTMILPTSLIEMNLIPHNYPRRVTGISSLGVLMTIYIVWTLIIAYVAKFWTYPILALLNWWQLVAFFSICVAVVIPFYILGEMLDKMRWGKLTGISSSKVN